MNGNISEWAANVKLLGNFVDATLSDSLDCRYKRLMFIGYVNKLISKFGHLQPKVVFRQINSFFSTNSFQCRNIVSHPLVQRPIYHIYILLWSMSV